MLSNLEVIGIAGALMIALAGYFRALKNEFTDPAVLRANGNLELA